MPTFAEVYSCLLKKGPADITSSRGTKYTVKASIVSKGDRKGDEVILAYPRAGSIYIHADCWGEDITCQKTRAGGVYNGSYSIYDWYQDNYK